MHWLLAALAALNVASITTVLAPRAVSRRAILWALFGTALLATELSWLWLPLQLSVAASLMLGGALDSIVGRVSVLVLLDSWSGLLGSIWNASRSGSVVEEALAAQLGSDYRLAIPTGAQARLRWKVRMRDGYRPLAMARPDVEVIRHIPYAPGGMRQQLDIYRSRAASRSP